ncbi:hypothetical protein C1H46_008700 [Malus baccata]|uniref:ArsA/GET3 Anion-transporting ATPase-like domain-containing protein n=1 Tax=Malus baccata TaxID=106549 RepID=A0A540N3Q8_MALBA|nr:hypothetical protein C1H46_008700 [Malus baccata]
MAAASDLPEGTIQTGAREPQEGLCWRQRWCGQNDMQLNPLDPSLPSQILHFLIISTDPAHNLSDAFQQKFTKTPTLVNGFTNLYAMEVDPTVEHEDVSGSDGMDNLFSDLANAIPGSDEAMSFAEMLKLVQTMDYSVIVFDTAPTGHTLRLLQFPSTLEKGLAKVMSLKNKFGGLMTQMTSLFGVGDKFGEELLCFRTLQRFTAATLEHRISDEWIDLVNLLSFVSRTINSY